MKADGLPSSQAETPEETWEALLQRQPLNNWSKYVASRGAAVDKPQEQTKDE